ncbi:MAG: isoamylase early set domain-containing protein, partial [Acidimicrobiales bacterium]
MLTKTWNAEDGRFDVHFDLPSELEIDHAAVVGDFNGWDAEGHPMTKGDDGRWTVTVSLEPGAAYRFRYHLG